MRNARKMPQWVLLDQLHIDVNIRSDMPASERKKLKSVIGSQSFHRLIRTIITGSDKNNTLGDAANKNSIRVFITK
jgi:hypothetical protein